MCVRLLDATTQYSARGQARFALLKYLNRLVTPLLNYVRVRRARASCGAQKS
jgi:hypothetical protein